MDEKTMITKKDALEGIEKVIAKYAKDNHESYENSKKEILYILSSRSYLRAS